MPYEFIGSPRPTSACHAYFGKVTPQSEAVSLTFSVAYTLCI